MSAASYATTPDSLSDELIASYRRQGFEHIPGIISSAVAAKFREAAPEAGIYPQ